MKKNKETPRKDFQVVRFLFVIVIIVIFMSFGYYNCLYVKFASVEDFLKVKGKESTVVILYGSGVCNSCSAGKYIYSIREDKDVTYIVPENFKESDIENLKDVFGLKGRILKGNSKVETLVKRAVNCGNLKEEQRNFLLKAKKNGNIESISHI
jgi:hypothetical protein